MGQQHELDAAGFTEFVGKPIDPEILFAKLARYAPRP
jgi:CheY-like chemotaxis protein